MLGELNPGAPLYTATPTELILIYPDIETATDSNLTRTYERKH